MRALTISKQIASILFPLLTFIIALLGLNTWRKKLWGENKFTLALNVVKELFLLKEEIRNYRSPFYPAQEMYQAFLKAKESNAEEEYDNSKAEKYAEIVRWNKVIEQYELYKSDLLKFKVLINNYSIDIVENENIDKMLKEINSMRITKEMRDKRKDYPRFMDDKQREDYYAKEEIMYEMLSYMGENDKLDARVNAYFKEMNKRIRKYVK